MPDVPVRARAFSSSNSSSSSSSQQQATSTGDVAAATQALKDRGIVDPERLLEFASPDAVLGACRWYDEQHGRVGPGVLVNEVKAGGKAGWSPKVSPRDAARLSALYQAEVWAWCAENFPDLCDEQGLANPHAVAEVCRLHMVYGKGSITVEGHGPRIRAVVEHMTNGGEA